MRKSLLVAAAAAMALASGHALAQSKKQLVIVVKGLDNPFFEAINQGCQKWNSENAASEYECFYTGPASTSDEAGEAQIVQDMLGKPSTAAIAISPSNAKLIAQTIKTANPTVPVMTLDADLAAEDSALRKTYLGTDNYLMGVRIGEYIKEKKPDGGTVCTIQGNPGADNILRRAQGTRDALSGQKGIAALAGEGGWTEVAGCPVFTNDDGAKGVQAMTDILAANPDLDAFAIESRLECVGLAIVILEFLDGECFGRLKTRVVGRLIVMSKFRTFQEAFRLQDMEEIELDIIAAERRDIAFGGHGASSDC